jgi:hypothetical protein
MSVARGRDRQVTGQAVCDSILGMLERGYTPAQVAGTMIEIAKTGGGLPA